MKEIKGYYIVWIFMLAILMGGKAQAMEQVKDSKAQEILIKMQKEQEQVKVLQLEILVDRQSMMQCAFDSNAGVSYINLFGSEVWVDEKAKITYVKQDGKYYFEPNEGDDFVDNEIEDITDEISDENSLAGMTYDGIVMFKNQECYKLTNIQNVDGEEIYTDYYINMQYQLAGVVTQSGESSSEIVLTYPESYSIPGEVKKNAELVAGYKTKKSKVTYISKTVKGKTVFYAQSAKGAKGSLKILDNIKVCGKTYKVYGISSEAFKGNKKITSVTIGKNVVKIGKKSFYKCSRLKNVKIYSKSLNYVGSKAFYGNAKKLKVKVPKSRLSKYKKMIKKAKTSSRITVTKK